jgi:hypothetical protein
MPALVGGFGNEIIKKSIYLFTNNNYNNYKPLKNSNDFKNISTKVVSRNTQNNSNLGSYLAGLIEGDGTFAIHNNNSTAKKYRPMIIIVFKKGDLPLAEYLHNLTKCGSIYIKPERGYILWQIQDIVGVYTIVNLINGYMRTPKIEALNRTIKWLNDYRDKNINETNSIISEIVSNISNIEIKGIDNSPIESNPWLSGFSDADSNFSINIHKRSDKNSTRVQLYYRLEIRQTYHRLTDDGNTLSFFSIMSKISNFLGTNLLSRNRTKEDKVFYSFIVTAHNKPSLNLIINYFNTYPLLSSKHLDFLAFTEIFELQNVNNFTTSYLDKALIVRKDFNKTRTTYKWDHLKNCYLTKKDF